jgi:hypothetical protein
MISDKIPKKQTIMELSCFMSHKSYCNFDPIGKYRLNTLDMGEM